MEIFLYALLTIIGWGIWLAPSQNIPFKNQQIKTFYVTTANLVIAFVVGTSQGLEHLNFKLFLFPFIGGMIWVLGGWTAFTATKRLGMVKAEGIWAPLNIIISILWGMILFGEFLKSGLANELKAVLSVLSIIVGIIFIVLAGSDKGEKKNGKNDNCFDVLGILASIGAGVLWGSYFIPIQLAHASLWITAFPMAVGMFAGSIVLVLLSREKVKLEKNTYYYRTLLTGALWACGNYGSLKMMELIGTGKGFIIAQMAIVINTIVGIFWFKNPDPKKKEAKIAFIGIILAAIGGVVLGNLR